MYSAPIGVEPSFTVMWLSQMLLLPGVVGSPSPVCQMPAPLFWNRGFELPSGMAVWKPQVPVVTYSQVSARAPPARLVGCLNPNQPPLLRSKLQGTLSPAAVGVGPVVENRIPLSKMSFGIRSSSPVSRVPLPFRSSPSVLLTSSLATVGVEGLSAPRMNMLEKVTSSSGLTMPRNGSVTSGRSI